MAVPVREETEAEGQADEQQQQLLLLLLLVVVVVGNCSLAAARDQQETLLQPLSHVGAIKQIQSDEVYCCTV